MQPLRDEVQQLANDSEGLRTKTKELNDTIAELEKSIDVYKKEYAELINETQVLLVLRRHEVWPAGGSEEEGKWRDLNKTYI